MEEVDVIIIGAGVVGLAVASEVGRQDRDVFLLEKNPFFGQEASSRNSEVIHAGIYYVAGSMKAMCCIEGRRLLYDLCERYGIENKKTGKLIVALDDSQVVDLERLYNNAKANGIKLNFLSSEEIRRIAPSVVAKSALFSSETGIIDSHALMKFFLNKAIANGVDVVYEAEVVGIIRRQNRYIVEVVNQGERVDLSTAVVINCAGNHADKIAAMVGLDIEKYGYEQYYLKGNYFRLADRFRGILRHLVYPVPDKNFLGIHTVLDLGGSLRLGPDAHEVDDIDYNVAEQRQQIFFEAAKRYLPMVKEEDLFPDTAGIRAQLRRPNRGDFRDFVICHEEDKGFPGLINLIGIESPGLTSSPYIGRYVADIVNRIV